MAANNSPVSFVVSITTGYHGNADGTALTMQKVGSNAEITVKTPKGSESVTLTPEALAVLRRDISKILK